MELRHLRYFLAVAKYQNFRKAAESLYVSQPPLSRQIKELEEEIGITLFDRKDNHTVLTPAGAYFQREVERILQDIDSAVLIARSLGAESGRTLRIGCVNTYVGPICLPVIQRYRERYPDFKIEMQVMPSEGLTSSLRSGVLHVCLMRLWQKKSGLVYDSLYRERLILIFPSSRYDGIDPHECMRRLAAKPFVTISEKTVPGLSRLFASIFMSYDIKPATGLEIYDTPTIISIVAADLGWSIVPELSLHENVTGLGKIVLPFDINVGICYRDSPTTESCAKFIELIKDYFSQDVSHLLLQ